MMANNKIHLDTDRDRPVHDISSQRHGRPSYDPTEYPCDRPTHHQSYPRYAKYERPRGHEQAQEQEQEEQEHLDHLYHRRGHPNQLDEDDGEPQQRSMNSIPSMAIHPTIANLVTPKSARSTQHSPPSPPLPSPPLHRLPSFSRRSFSPASSFSSCSSLSPRNVPISPEPESEPRLQQDHHYHHYYYNHRHHYYKDQMRHKSSDPFHDRGLPYHDHENRQNFDSARTSSPSSRAQRWGSQDREMEVDTGVGAGATYAYEELSSDVMMDQCEPQRDWSSTLSQRTNSPSPVMSCTMYPLAPPSWKQSSYLHHQELPPLLPQPICDQHERCSSPPMHRQEHFHSEAHQHQHHGPHHPYQDSYPSHYHQRRHSLRTAPISSWSDANTGVGLTSSSSSSSSSSAAAPLFRSKTASAMRTFPSWRSRTRPFSVPNYPSADFLQQPHSSAEGLPSTMQSSALQMPATVAQTKQEGPLSRPLTPPSRETWCNDQQQQQKLSQQQQQQSTARGTLPITTSTTTNPPSWRKSFEHVSEAQRVLYERHPPSPKKYDRVSTCASSSSTSSSSCSALPSSSSSSSAELSTSSSSSVSPPSAPPSPPSPSHIPHTPVAGSPVLSSSFEQGFNAPPRPLTRFPSPVPNSRLPQSNLSQQQQQQQHQHQKQYEFKHCSFQSPEPASTLSNQRPDEENHETGLIARKSLANSANPAAGPKVPLILPKAAVSESPVTPLPGTEGLTVLRNEEGAIVVFNQATDTMSFRCELCPTESFGRIHDLKRHQTSKHQEMTWPCDFCHRPFVRRDALLRHYTVKAARDDGLHPASHEVEKLRAARARAKMLS